MTPEEAVKALADIDVSDVKAATGEAHKALLATVPHDVFIEYCRFTTRLSAANMARIRGQK